MIVESTHITIGSPHTSYHPKIYTARLKNLKGRLEIRIVMFVLLKCT